MLYTDRINRHDQNALAEVLDIPFLFRHRHSTGTFLEHYRAIAKQAAANKLAGLREIAPSLLDLASDEKTLHAAFTRMKATGSHAPGPDGLRYEDIESIDIWKYFRGLRDEIRAGGYAPSDEHVHKISKGPGRGFRELTIQSVEDRVVQRAVVEIVQPLLDPLFDPWSFGFRPKKGPLRALATAERLHADRGLGVWVSADIRNAFPSVPLDRLAAVLRKYTPDDDWLAFLDAVVRSDQTPGLRQGGPLSPLLLNLYLHHTLDRVWRRKHPNTPLLRFADDILLLCRTAKRARTAYRELADLLQPAGFVLKEDEGEAIKSLTAGQQLAWMGYGIALAPAGLRITVTERAWEKLDEALTAARDKPLPPLRAIETVAAWVNDKAPCYPHANVSVAYDRVKTTAAANGFSEIPTRSEFAEMWQLAHARWCRLRKAVATTMSTDEGGE